MTSTTNLQGKTDIFQQNSNVAKKRVDLS